MGGGNDHGRGGSVTWKKMLRAVDEHTTASDTSARGFGQGLRWINPSAIYPLIIVTSIVIVGNVRALLF